MPSLSSAIVSLAPDVLPKRVSPAIDWLPLPAVTVMSLGITWLRRGSTSRNTSVSVLAALGSLTVKVALSVPASLVVVCEGPVRLISGAELLWVVASAGLAVVASSSTVSTERLGLRAA